MTANLRFVLCLFLRGFFARDDRILLGACDRMVCPISSRHGGCAAVHEVDPATPCMVGPGPYYKLWRFAPTMLLNEKNVIYTFDYFVPEAFTFGESSIPT